MFTAIKSFIARLFEWFRALFNTQPQQPKGETVMSALSIQPSYPVFTDSKGEPLESGYVWIGVANLDPQVNPIAVYWDAALTQPAAQPIRTEGGYPTYNGAPARLYVNSDYSIRVQDKNGSLVYSAPTATERYSGVVIDGLTIDSSDVDFLQSGSGAVAQSVRSKLRNGVDVCVFDFMTDAEIVAVQAYSFSTDVTAGFQNAINEAWASERRLIVPPGGYLVTGLTLTGASNTQNQTFAMHGSRAGNPFAAWSIGRGAVIKSTTDAPVFAVNVPTTTTSAGTLDVSGVIFDGTSNSYPVVFLQAFYGIGEFHHNCVFQRGSGDGIEAQWMTTSEIHDCYVLNKDWAATALGAARVGVGIYLNHQYDSGLQTIRKCSSRGWNKAYKVGNGALTHWTYNASIENCEASTVYHGIHLTYNARASWVNNCYLEGGDGGYALWDEGDYNKITNCFTFAGFGTHLKSDQFTYGNVYTGNILAAGTKENQILVSITSSSVNGGPGKVCSMNHLSFGGSGGTLAGVVGFQLNGTDPRVDMSGNTYYPRGAWVGGAGTAKQLIPNHGYAFSMVTNGDLEFPYLSQGAISLGKGYSITQTDVTANVLYLQGGSFFDVAATVATSVNKFSTGGDTGRLVTFKTTNANLTFTNSAYVKLAGAVNFTGPGTITFIVEEAGGANYAYEIARTVF